MSSTTANRKEILDAIEPTQEGIHRYLDGKSRKLTDKELSYLLRKNTALYKRVIDNNLTFDDVRYFLLTNTPIETRYCEVCHKQVHILHGHISREFPRTCSNACKNKLVGIANVKLTDEQKQQAIAKKKQTNIERFGAISPLANKEVRAKGEATMKERYGTDNAFKSEVIKAKIRKTNKERYGNEVAIKSDAVKQKRDATMVAKYGIKSAFEDRDKIVNAMESKYGVDNPFKLKETQDKAKATIKERYGVENISQSKERRKQVIIEQANKGYDSIMRLAKDNDVKPMFSLEEYINTRLTQEKDKYGTTFKWKCNACGDVFDSPYVNGMLPICRKCHPISRTEEERDLIDCVSTIYKGEIRTHVRDVIPPYELDIYIPEKKLAIEFNGAYWHSTSAGKDNEHHLTKTRLCEARGIHLIHIWEWDWVNNRNKVDRRLMAYLGESHYTLFARKCHASVLTAREDIEQAKDMLNNIHLQGDIPAKVYVALYNDDGKMEAVMSFGKPRFNKDYQWELYRYCSSERVIGGASKLLKCFVRNYHPKSIITYADRCWSSKNNNVYKAMGFEYAGESKPSYVYANRNGQILSRYQCQKARIAEEEGDNELRETEIMARKGFFKVYDCGNLIYEKKF